MKFDERNQKLLKIPPFLFPWQLRQSLSYRFLFFWLISFSQLLFLGTTSTSSKWNEISQKNQNRLDKLCRSCHGNKKGGMKF
jgi:hypothetical protein